MEHHQRGSDAIQRQVGDFSEHDERYERAIEFMDVVKGYWNNETFHYDGKFYKADGGGLRGPQKRPSCR